MPAGPLAPATPPPVRPPPPRPGSGKTERPAAPAARSPEAKSPPQKCTPPGQTQFHQRLGNSAQAGQPFHPIPQSAPPDTPPTPESTPGDSVRGTCEKPASSPPA